MYKIDKVKTLTVVGKYNSTFHALWEQLPSVLISSCSAWQLALILETMWEQFRAGEIKGFEEGQKAQEPKTLAEVNNDLIHKD